jgi:acyl-CoA reductase-like NAD-dependent aldehyde dehydrogenase
MEFSPDGPMAIPMWVNGHAFLTVTPDFYTVTNPVTGESLRRIPLCGAEEAAEAVKAAQAAQAEWAMMGMPARRVCLGRLADGLDRYTGHFAKLLIQECGFDEARATAEVGEAVEALRGAMVGETGVLGIVLDATRPLASFAETMGPALMAGATLVVKPSPKAPSAVFALCELTAREEWPAGVVNLLQGDSAAVEGLCASAVDRLVYCGNAALGAQVGAMAEAAGKSFEMKAA